MGTTVKRARKIRDRRAAVDLRKYDWFMVTGRVKGAPDETVTQRFRITRGTPTAYARIERRWTAMGLIVDSINRVGQE